MAVTTPTLPLTGIVQPNQTGQWVDVNLTGGTVTNVTVTTAQGTSATVATATGVNYAIPPGGSHTITYTGSPVQVWTDPLETNEVPYYSAENLTLINEQGQLPWPAHEVGGETGLGEAVSN